jgi:response regulator of citrate/malate metabolism
MKQETDFLRGVQLLIVEDEFLLARELANYFEDLGAQIVGPAGTVKDALTFIKTYEIQAAVLDINLRDGRVYPVADVLTQQRTPFVFASGYGSEVEPEAYAGIPRCIKPIDFAVLGKTLEDQIKQQT